MTTPNYQCYQKDFTVKPYSCTLATLTGTFWMSNNLVDLGMMYTIGSGNVKD
jgi:hypothetical protein